MELAAEMTFAHADLLGENRNPQVSRGGAVDEVLGGTHRRTASRWRPGRRGELALAAGTPDEHHQKAGDLLRQLGSMVGLHQSKRKVDARRHAPRRPDTSL